MMILTTLVGAICLLMAAPVSSSTTVALESSSTQPLPVTERTALSSTARATTRPLTHYDVATCLDKPGVRPIDCLRAKEAAPQPATKTKNLELRQVVIAGPATGAAELDQANNTVEATPEQTDASRVFGLRRLFVADPPLGPGELDQGGSTAPEHAKLRKNTDDDDVNVEATHRHRPFPVSPRIRTSTIKAAPVAFSTETPGAERSVSITWNPATEHSYGWTTGFPESEITLPGFPTSLLATPPGVEAHKKSSSFSITTTTTLTKLAPTTKTKSRVHKTATSGEGVRNGVFAPE